jgi:hypothetical protein
MTDRDWWTTEAMRRYGGSFVLGLGRLAALADGDNFARIKAAWPEYWANYEITGRALQKAEERYQEATR